MIISFPTIFTMIFVISDSNYVSIRNTKTMWLWWRSWVLYLKYFFFIFLIFFWHYCYAKSIFLTSSIWLIFFKLLSRRGVYRILYITPCVKCGFTQALRAEIRIFTLRDIKFRTILVRKTFSWRVWLHHSPSARAASSRSSEKVLWHSYRNVLFIRAWLHICMVIALCYPHSLFHFTSFPPEIPSYERNLEFL